MMDICVVLNDQVATSVSVTLSTIQGTATGLYPLMNTVVLLLLLFISLQTVYLRIE